MDFCKVKESSDVTYCLRLNKGEEIFESLAKICKQQKIKSGYFTGIGATDDATVGVFNPNKKKYISVTLKRPMEITSLVGNISTLNREPYLHAHISLCDETLNTKGGHLNRAIISVTAEIFITKLNTTIGRVKDLTTGINIFKFK